MHECILMHSSMSYTPAMDDSSLSVAGARLAQLRGSYELTQTALAKLAGIDQSVLSRLERGEIAEPSVSCCQRLMDVFKLGVDPLFGSDDQWRAALSAVKGEQQKPKKSMWLGLPQWLRDDVAASRHVMITGSMGSGKTQLLIDVLKGLQGLDSFVPYVIAGDDRDANACELVSRLDTYGDVMYDFASLLKPQAHVTSTVVLPELHDLPEHFRLLTKMRGRTLTTFHADQVNTAMSRLGVGAAVAGVSIEPYLARGILVLHTQKISHEHRVVEVAQLFNSHDSNPHMAITRHCITETGNRRPGGPLRKIHNMIHIP